MSEEPESEKAVQQNEGKAKHCNCRVKAVTQSATEHNVQHVCLERQPFSVLDASTHLYKRVRPSVGPERFSLNERIGRICTSLMMCMTSQLLNDCSICTQNLHQQPRLK